MAEKRFVGLTPDSSAEVFRVRDYPAAAGTKSWDLSPATKAASQEIDRNLRSLARNVARSASIHSQN